MRYLKTAFACTVVGAAFATTPAWAETNLANGPSGAHYASGYQEPLCGQTTSPLGVSCSNSVIGGVGHTNATLSLDVTYSATVTCTNHGGTTVAVKTQFPKSNDIGLTPSAKNGQLVVPAVSSTAPSAKNFEDRTTCPNPNWTKRMDPSTLALEGFLYTLTFDGFNDLPFISISAP